MIKKTYVEREIEVVTKTIEQIRVPIYNVDLTQDQFKFILALVGIVTGPFDDSVRKYADQIYKMFSEYEEVTYENACQLFVNPSLRARGGIDFSDE